MIKNKELTHLEHSRVKLSLTIEKEAAEKEYAELLAKYAKEAHLAGFRKGKVPVSVLERKFGEGIKAEVIEKIIQDSLKTVFDEIEEKPIPYESPELQEDAKLNFGEDFSFAVAYDIFPKVETGPYTGLTVEKPVVKISEDDEKRELDAIVEQNSFIVEKDGEAEKDNRATVDFWELDDSGAEIANSKNEDMPLVVGEDFDIYGIAVELAGMKKGETREITKTYPDDYKEKELAGKTKKFMVALKGLREKKLPVLDDELAQDVSEAYKTLDDMKADIRKRLEASAADSIRSMTVEALLEQVVEKSVIDLPESMIRAEQDRMWRQFAMRLHVKEEFIETMLASQNKTKDAIYEEWRPQSEKSLKMQLCIEKMIEAEKIEVSDEELDAAIIEQAGDAGATFEELKGVYEKDNMLGMVRRDELEKKLFDQVLEKNTLVSGKEVSLAEAMGRRQSII